MKRILFYTCLAAFTAACVAPAADEPAPAAPAAGETPAPAAAEDESAEGEEAPAAAEEEKEASAADIIAALKKRKEEIDRLFADLAKPNKSTTQMYNRHVEEVKERVKKMEEIKTQMDELEAKQRNSGGVEYIFSTVPEDERYKYETEGNELATKTLNALNGKSEAAQIEGLRLFEMLRETYQGLPQFKEANAIYQKLVSKFEKKWSTLLDNIKRERQKWPASRKDKVTEGEQAQYDYFVRKFEGEKRDVEEDWFLPRPNNALLVDKALARARRAKTVMQNRTLEDGGKVPELLHLFWANMDEVRDLMVAGKLEEAYDKSGDDKSGRELLGMNRYMLPESVKEGIRKESDALRNEIRKRQGEARSLDRDITRVRTSFEREVRYLEARMDRMLDTLLAAKDDEVHRAEEAAAREAEIKEQQEREAAEAAEDDEDDDEAADEKPEVKKSKKKKSSKKKKAE